MALAAPQMDNDGQDLTPHEDRIFSLPASSSLQSLINSWPAQLCLKCASMTATVGGLRDLISPDGYIHHKRSDLEDSIRSGCKLCKRMSRLLSRDWGDNNSILVLGCGGDPLGENGGRMHPLSGILGGLVFKLIPAREGGPLMNKSISTLTQHIFTDANEPEYSNSVVIDEGNNVHFSIRQLPLSVPVTGKPIVERCKRLLINCTSNHHSTCPPNLNAKLPSRVIDVAAEHSLDRLNLHISAQGERARYVALSYCWGDPPHTFATTRAILDDPSKIHWGDMPTTIRDAVAVTRSLGIRYLWVDAVCIAQDDEADKTREIKTMGQVYKNATITIAAASSPSVKSGFLEDKAISKFPVPLSLPGGGYGTLWIRTESQSSGPLGDLEPLDKRGWAFQESLLSPRILYYASKDLIWKCQERPLRPPVATHNLYTMTDPAIQLPLVHINNASQNIISVRRFWFSIQRDYSVRNLKLSEDHFRALGGIAEELQRVSKDTYMAGMWKSLIIESLAWFRDKNVKKEDGQHHPHLGPSWSWLSSPHPSWTYGIDEEDEKPELISWSVDLADKNSPFGHVLGGTLHIMATIIKSTKAPLSNKKFIFDCDILGKAEDLAGNFVSDEYHYCYIGGSGASAFGLLLRSLEDGVFVREGLIRTDKKENLWSSEDTSRIEIRIV